MKTASHFTLVTALFLFCAGMAYGQGIQIASVSPAQANSGDTGITVTATLESDGAPPDQIQPNNFSIGEIAGTNLSRSSLDITATFDFPAETTAGLYDVTLVFPAPENGEITATLSNGFQIGDGGDTSFMALEVSRAGAYLGYTLFSTIGGGDIYLVDMKGQLAHNWTSSYSRGTSADYLMNDGSLLRATAVNNAPTTFEGSSGGGRIEWLNPDGSVKWYYELATESALCHHDIEPLPNGNILCIVWVARTQQEALDAGRSSGSVTSDGLWYDAVYEIAPSGSSGGEIVWEWHMWDHLIQDEDSGKANYGVVAQNPGKININFDSDSQADWTHTNSIDYNAERDEILLSVRNFSEIWVIDHSLTTAQAATDAGDLLYRWGNPQAHDAGSPADQKIFVQHDARWVESGYPGAGNITLFDNGQGRPAGNYSAIVEITPEMNGDAYALNPGAACGPSTATWTYTAPTPTDFYADHISGAHRLPNGNTMICEGTTGRFFEVQTNGDIDWQFQNPYTASTPQGDSSTAFRALRVPWNHPGLEALGLAQPECNLSYPVIDTNQHFCCDNDSPTAFPEPGTAFYGQDAQYDGLAPRYQDNGDGTITDLVTGLMWQKSLNPEGKVTFADAVNDADTYNQGGYTDWRLPTIKELYSLMDFRGSCYESSPYLDTSYFEFKYGDESAGEREIDAQFWSATEYVGYTYGDSETVFGVNFADGRIKGYPKYMGATENEMYARYVRGNPDYGINQFVDNGDGTITDQATGLMWQKADSGSGLNWEDALAYAEGLELAGYDDWRLPDAKELQSIVDYTRAPEAVNPAVRSAAIDPIFDLTETESWFWTGTNFHDTEVYTYAVYVTFGQAFGIYDGEQIDVHGAGAQRSDPKTGNPDDYSEGFGPQNDEIRIFNYVRAVRRAYYNTTPPAPALPAAATTWALYD